MLQLKTVAVLVATVITLLLGVLAVALALPAWALYLALAVLVLGAYALATKVVYASEYFGKFHLSRRRFTLAWLVGAVLAHATWLAMWAQAADLRWWLAGGLLVLAFCEYVLTDLVHWWLTRPVKEQAVVQASRAEVADRKTATALETFQRALSASGFEYLTVPADQVRLKSADSMTFVVVVPPKAAARIALEEKVESSKKSIPPFGPGAREQIAIALHHVTGRPWRTDWVEITNIKGYAGIYQVSITSRDVLHELKVYVDDPRPRSFMDPFEFSTSVDGTREGFQFTGHGEIIAMTGSGKSNLLTLFAAHTTLCTLPDGEAIFLACGRQKQYETWGQFLLKYKGTGRRIPIRVVNGQRDTVNLLYAVLRLVQYRQNKLLDQRGRRPWIVLTLDEAKHVLQDNSIGIRVGKKFLTASVLWDMLVQTAWSSQVILIRVGHRGTNGQAGDQGGDIKTNSAWSIVLRSGDHADAGRVLNVHNLPPLETPGEMYLRWANQVPRRRKTDYMQEVGKPHAPKTNGITIPDVGWNRRDFIVDLDADEVQAAGDFFANLAQYMTPEFEAYLRKTAEEFELDEAQPEQAGATSVGKVAYDEAKTKLLAAVGLAPKGSSTPAVLASTSSSPTTAPAPTAVAVVDAQPPTWTDRVEQLVLAAEQGLTSAEIITQLRQTGELTTQKPGVVHNALKQLRDEGRIDQPGGRGKPYVRPASVLV